MNLSMNNKVVVVTGSTRGIGLAVAEEFLRNGASVILNARAAGPEGDSLARRLSQSSAARYIKADVSNEIEAQSLIQQVVDEYGRIDVLVNNAGRTEAMPFAEGDAAHWINMLCTNLMSTVYCSRAACRVMLEQGGGCIINTSSIRGLEDNGRPAIMAYSAAKAAVNNFTRTLAKEMAPTVRVNAIAPGFVATSYMDRTEESMKQKWLEEIPIGRFIEPAEIAQLYVQFAESQILTGTILVADGGFTLHQG